MDGDTASRNDSATRWCPTTPALVPLMIPGDDASAIHRDLSGVSLRVRLDVRVDGKVAARIPGSLLWTHFGISGPATLDASRHWLRARLDGRQVALSASLCPSESFESLEPAVDDFRAHAAADEPADPRRRAPAGIGRDGRSRPRRDPRDSDAGRAHARGTAHADPNFARMAAADLRLARLQLRGSDRGRRHAPGDRSLVDVVADVPGLTLVGEILDVDGRIGGFNFQWAWSTARVAGEALAALYSTRVPAP
jgi:hypothetical protein